MTIQANQIDEKVSELDLSKITFKFLNGDEKEKWNDCNCKVAEQEYKRFLTLLLLYPNEKIIPNKLMDVFWHQHILDTRKYAEDCKKIFGYFLHHNPYYGLTSIEEFEQFQADFSMTKKLYEQHFGEQMPNLNYGLCDNDGSNCASTGGDSH